MAPLCARLGCLVCKMNPAEEPERKPVAIFMGAGSLITS